MREYLIIAGVILLFEASLGIGIFGMGYGTVFVVVFIILAIAQRQQRSQWLRLAGIYALVFFATMGWFWLNIKVGQTRAAPVISAVNRYHAERGRYPKTLDELAPAYLPFVPHAGFTLMSRDFRYFNDGKPQLYFVAMFHGIFAYDFPTNTWRTNE